MIAPDFTLPDQNGKIHKLSDYKGAWVVLYFYPKDDTSGCTKEACSFRDNMATLKEKNVVVLGVSGDSPLSHQAFIHKNKLNFTLLCDESLEMIKAYKAWGKKTINGKEYTGIKRVTYLINPQGETAKFYDFVDPNNNVHTQQILSDLKVLQK